MELRNHRFGVPTVSEYGEGNMKDSVKRERSFDTAESETRACVEAPCARPGGLADFRIGWCCGTVEQGEKP
jgi:hypothetical protein